MSVLKKIGELISLSFTKEEQEQIKKEADKMKNNITVTLTSAKTKSGVEISYEGELKAGTPVMVVNADGNKTPAPDGSHELEDGTVIVVAAGLVTEVKPKETAASPDANAVAQMQTQMSAQKANFELQLKTQNETIKTLTDHVLKLSKAIDAILNTELNVGGSSSDDKQIDFDNLSNYDKVKLNHNGKI
jgi:hypothetical protein